MTFAIIYPEISSYFSIFPCHCPEIFQRCSRIPCFFRVDGHGIPSASAAGSLGSSTSTRPRRAHGRGLENPLKWCLYMNDIVYIIYGCLWWIYSGYMHIRITDQIHSNTLPLSPQKKHLRSHHSSCHPRVPCTGITLKECQSQIPCNAMQCCRCNDIEAMMRRGGISWDHEGQTWTRTDPLCHGGRLPVVAQGKGKDAQGLWMPLGWWCPSVWTWPSTGTCLPPSNSSYIVISIHIVDIIWNNTMLSLVMYISYIFML